MGQYLCVGLCTDIRASRKNVEKQYGSTDEYIRYVTKEFNMSTELYEVHKDDEDVSFTLNPQILERDLQALLEQFYAMCYAGADTKELGCDGVLEALKECKNAADIYKLSGEKCYFCFQDGFHYDYVKAPFPADNMLVSVNSIILSFAGKIIIESTGGLFSFFTRLLRRQFGDIQLSGALNVYIDG